MKIVLIGSGNVATVLGRKFKSCGHEVLQVISRNLEHARLLGRLLDCEVSNDFSRTSSQGELYFVCLSDAALSELYHNLHLNHSLVVHSAGSVSKDVLQKVSTNYGVIYPLQSLRMGMETIPEIPLLVDGNTPESLTLIEDFAKTVADQVLVAGDEMRMHVHLAAVVCSNFVNHLFMLADDYCARNDVPFRLLLPLIHETVNRMEYYSPEAVQTGPAARNDKETIRKHLALLEEFPPLRKIYGELTESIRRHYQAF